jgi:hypothetical protein
MANHHVGSLNACIKLGTLLKRLYSQTSFRKSLGGWRRCLRPVLHYNVTVSMLHQQLTKVCTRHALHQLWKLRCPNRNETRHEKELTVSFGWTSSTLSLTDASWPADRSKPLVPNICTLHSKKFIFRHSIGLNRAGG